jgi:hypothetical protein
MEKNNLIIVREKKRIFKTVKIYNRYNNPNHNKIPNIYKNSNLDYAFIHHTYLSIIFLINYTYELINYNYNYHLIISSIKYNNFSVLSFHNQDFFHSFIFHNSFYYL